MARPKKKGGNKSKPAKKVAVKKSGSNKAKPAKPAKVKSAPKAKSTAKVKNSPKVAPKASAPTPVVSAPVSKKVEASTPTPVVAETQKVATPVTVPTPKEPTPAPLPVAPVASVSVKNSAYALDALINSHRSAMRKEDVEKFLADNSQIQAIPTYSATGYFLDVYELGKKVIRLPFNGEYALAV